MTNLPPLDPSLDEPVAQSSFARAKSYRIRRTITVFIAIGLLTGGAYEIYLWKRAPAVIPTIHAEGSLKQKPDQPGGIDIPNQDVTAYQQIDKSEGTPSQNEHLLPPPETPQKSAPVPPSPDHGPIGDGGGSQSVENLIAPQPVAIKTTVTPPKALDKDTAIAPAPVPQNAPLVVAPQSSLPIAAVPTPPSPLASVPATPPALDKLSASPPMALPPIAVPAPAPIAPNVSPQDLPPIPLAAVPPTPATTPIIAAPTMVPHSMTTSAAGSSHVQADSDNELADNSSDTTPSPATKVSQKGNFSAQLASIPDQEMARQEMAKMQEKFSSQLSGAKLHLVKADLGTRGIFYRVETAKMSESDAKSVCVALRNLKAGCIVVKP